MTTLVLKVTLVLLAAFLVELGLKKASATARHFLWSITLASLPVVAALSLLSESWDRARIPVTIPILSSPSAEPTVEPRRQPVGGLSWSWAQSLILSDVPNARCVPLA